MGINNKTFVIDLKLFRKSIDNLDDDVDDAKLEENNLGQTMLFCLPLFKVRKSKSVESCVLEKAVDS